MYSSKKSQRLDPSRSCSKRLKLGRWEGIRKSAVDLSSMHVEYSFPFLQALDSVSNSFSFISFLRELFGLIRGVPG